MAITARNYAAQAQRGMIEWAKAMERAASLDSRMATLLADAIGESVHFVMPDDGIIIGDGLKGIIDRQVRLPFRSITVEYYATGEQNSGSASELLQAPKRVILAQEINKSEMEKYVGHSLPHGSEMWIAVNAACLIGHGSDAYWTPIPTGWAMPCDWYDKGGATPMLQSFASHAKGINIPGIPLATLPESQKKIIDKYGDSGMADLVHDIAGEVSAIMELCEALSCSNVRHEPIEKVDQKKNSRRIRDGKLPIYETRMLVVETGKHSVSVGSVHGESSRNGPRQHLRRGHIRRLPDERRIWVNSCIVGAANEGVIDKAYTVKNAA